MSGVEHCRRERLQCCYKEELNNKTELNEGERLGIEPFTGIFVAAIVMRTESWIPPLSKALP